MPKKKPREIDVCIVGGLGHVGLPLGISLANKGKKVVLYDINQQAIETVKSGKIPFVEVGAKAVLKKVINKQLFVSSEKKVIAQSHFVIIVIGTPVDEHLNPKFNVFIQFFDDIIDFICDGQHIILRSTVYPGTTDKINEYFIKKGKKVKVSFCPERIAEGMAMEELGALPQIVASFDKTAFNEAKKLFNCLIKEVIFLSPHEAELAKLFINTWRYIQFAISNQFYQIATERGVDFYRIYHAITYKYPRAKNFPKAGFAAGPCLFKDTMQLAAYSKNNFFLGHAAMLVNEGLPNFIIGMLKAKHLLSQKSVGILGMAFKANNDDKRESLSYKLKKMLTIEAKKVFCSDVYIKEDGFIDNPDDLISRCDIIILATPHKEYANLRFAKEKTVVDIWNFYGKGGIIK